MIDVLIGDSPKWNALNYSVAEDSTPIDPSDTSGGVSQFTVDLPEDAASVYERGETVLLSDGSRGVTAGIARSLSGNGATATITADSRLVALNVTRTAPPMSDDLEDVLLYYMGLCGISTDFSFDAAFNDVEVVVPGWTANVWTQIKSLAAIYGFEVALVSDIVTLRPIRQRTVAPSRFISRTWAIDDGNLAQAIEVAYYQPTFTTALAYPLGGWSPSTTILQVAALETVTTNVSLAPSAEAEGPGASLSTVIQPVCVDSVDPGDVPSSSIYTVVDKDGALVPATTWTANGGNISVAINDDKNSITITTTSGDNYNGSPYQIAMPLSDSQFYASLRIIGTGVFSDKRILKLQTGLDIDRSTTEVGTTVDLPGISTRAQAIQVASSTLAAYSGGTKTLNITTAGRFADSFENQAFGNIAGARFLDNYTMYRIRSVSALTPGTIAFTAEGDTTIADFNSAWAGQTIADFNSMWTGKTAGDYGATPLKTAASSDSQQLYPDMLWPDMLWPA